ncbi:geranylgeranyl pyrophosphate synthetase [Xylaria palmicola]|nr:geranylgeranyl pyrophosphate synthetase [Xylaria palmicola]
MAARTPARISRKDLREPFNGPAVIENVKHLASYSWIEASVPTIAVPGIPPRWSPPATPRPLRKDSGLVYIAQNDARYPQSPLEPLFRSLFIADPEFDVGRVDFITDRNNIRKLLSFIDPSSSRNGLESFKISVEAVGSTMLLSRIETKTTEVIAPHEFRGYGHEFEKAYTRCQLSDSTGYHRIVSYRFGGLSLIVRHEVDGYVSQPRSTTSSRSTTEDDGLAGLLGSLSLTTPGSAPSRAPAYTPPGSKMVIREEGMVVPLDSTLEIKTRVSHKQLDFQEIAAQLWASQTPKLVRAYHNRGLFQDTSVEDVAGKVKAWELANQKHLKRLVALLRWISMEVRNCGGRAVVECDHTSDRITVVPMVGAGRMLPQNLYARWRLGDKARAQRG